MADPNLQTAAQLAGLTGQQKSQIDGLSKLLDSHRKLLSMPESQAQATFAAKPQDQQNAHVALFGGDSNPIGWLGSAAHYVTNKVKEGIALPFKGLNEVSDFMTRLYRTGAIALDQGVDLGKAFTIANDKGDKVFSPSRIAAASQKYGSDMMNVAMKVAGGTPLDQILAEGTDAEKQIASMAAQKKDPLFQDALDAANAAKYSPGRQLANILLPEGMEGSGILYKGISGFADASYRIFADPTLALGKAKKAYDAANYAMFKLIPDPTKLEAAFAKPSVVNFFNAYGEGLTNLDKARKAKDTIAMEKASTQLRRLAPEFGPTSQDEFIKAGVKDAVTARNYLQNHADVTAIFNGQAGRVTPLLPRLDARRQARVLALTAGNKILNIDKVGQKLVQALYGTDGIQTQDILTGLNANAEAIAPLERQVGKFKQDGSVRLNLNTIQGKIDRFAAKFTAIPYFKDGYFDVASADAKDQVYRLARLGNTRYHSKIIAEAFAAGDEGQKKQIFTGLWNTLAEIRGVSKTGVGQSYLAEQAGKGLAKQYAADIETAIAKADGTISVERNNPAFFEGIGQAALFPYQLSSAMAVPSIVDLDRMSSRSGLIGRMMGISHSKWAEKMTSMWSIGTLAGPKFPVRNAAEDLMMHVAVGDSTWGIVKGRFLSTKLRQAEAKGNLGFINKLIYRNQTEKYAGRIAKAIEEGDVNATRTVMAQALLEHGLPAKLDDQGSEILAEIARYGRLDEVLAAVSEGGKNALRGGDQFLNTTNDVSKFGKMGAFEIDDIKYKQTTGDTSFTSFNPTANKQARIGWLMQLGITSNDELAKIAVKGLSDNPAIEAKTIAEMSKYLNDLPVEELNRFQSIASGVATIDDHARRAYEATKNLYSKADGTVNKDLWNKVAKVDKKGNIQVSTHDLRLEDLPSTSDLAPRFVHGPTMVPVTDTGNFASGLVDKTWDYMGEANARFSREPIVIDAMIRIRKEMMESGYDKHYMDLMTKGLSGEELAKAEEIAKRHLVGIAEDMAKNRVLAYVDNPAVRSQLAMSARNFARFYRATEDFYRRVYRAVRYNPEALTRASLTYEGISHSGFVQTDDNGDQYFFYPALTPVYKVMNKVGILFGVKDAFQVPLPVEFGGKLKMITPSMNPDSLFPTFAGPLAAVPMKMIGNVIPQVKDIEQYLTGSYGQDQPMISAVLPAHVNRLLQALSSDERNSQYASAARKAATYLEASGHGVSIKTDPVTGAEIPPSAGEIAAYQDKLQASTLTVLGMRFLGGFFAPASPQITLKSDMAQWVRDNQRTSYKQVFNNLIQQYNGDIDKASQEWIRLFPNQMPYTVSESEGNTVAVVRAVDGANSWIKNNAELLKRYPQAAAFLIPQAGKFDFNAYKLLFSEGLKSNKTLSDFVRQVSSAKDIQTYYDKKSELDQQLMSTTSVDVKRQLRDQWQTWADEFKGARPLLAEQLGAGSAKGVERAKALQDLRLMISDSKVPSSGTLNLLSQMLSTYDSYIVSRDMAAMPGSGMSQEYKDMIRLNAQQTIAGLAGTDANALAAYNSLFAPLFR